MKMPSFERDKMFYVCVRHYIGKRYSLDTAVAIARSADCGNDLKRVYEIILKEEAGLRKEPYSEDREIDLLTLKPE